MIRVFVMQITHFSIQELDHVNRVGLIAKPVMRLEMINVLAVKLIKIISLLELPEFQLEAVFCVQKIAEMPDVMLPLIMLNVFLIVLKDSSYHLQELEK